MRKKNLVRNIAAGVLAATVLALSACGAKENQTTSAAATESNASAGESGSQAESSAAAGESGASAEQSADAAAIEALNPVRPESLGEIKLGEYKGITVNTAEPYTVTDEDVESYLEYGILPNYTEEAETVEDGDTVNIDYEGKIDGKAFDGGTAKGQSLVIGSGSYIEGFETGLIGAKKGDKVSLNLKFPEDYGKEELNGKDVVFDVTVNSVSRKRVLDDALAKEIGTKDLQKEVNTVDELKTAIKSQMQESYDYQNRQQLSYDAIDAVVKNSEVTPSEEAVSWKVDDLVKNYYDPMLKQSYGFGLAQMLSMQGQSLDAFKTDIRDMAEQTISQMLVMESIAAAENFKVTDADIQKFAEENGTTVENLKSGASDEEIEEAVLQQLATDYVVDNAKVVYEAPEAESSAQSSAGDAE